MFQQVVAAGSRPSHFYGEIFFIFILRGENQASPGAEILRIVGTTTKRKKLSAKTITKVMKQIDTKSIIK